MAGESSGIGKTQGVEGKEKPNAITADGRTLQARTRKAYNEEERIVLERIKQMAEKGVRP